MILFFLLLIIRFFLEGTLCCLSARIPYHNHDNVARHITHCIRDLDLRPNDLPCRLSSSGDTSIAVSLDSRGIGYRLIPK